MRRGDWSPEVDVFGIISTALLRNTDLFTTSDFGSQSLAVILYRRSLPLYYRLAFTVLGILADTVCNNLDWYRGSLIRRILVQNHTELHRLSKVAA